ncbi:MAG TPA: tetratricopeptide repeat protein [Tepidisphaeraceae bacterium]|nr:tetratricopeptide repeat protein [Tepidisphaeraceae bacterium]
MTGRINTFIVLGMFLTASIVSAAPRLYIDSRPTNLDPSDPIGHLIFREMPRQALIVAATEDFGAICIDPTVEPGVLPRDGDVRIGLDRKAIADRLVLHIELFDSKDGIIDRTDLDQKVNEKRMVYLDDFARQCDDLLHDKWESLLAKQLKKDPSPPKWDPSLPVPAEVDRLLSTIDFDHAFLAARLTHLEISQTGESTARLGALIRAYVHLGESTRHLVAGQSVGFFARALLYSQRLIRLAPNDPASYWHRAYAEGLYGINLGAQADMKRAADLGGDEMPHWVTRLRGLLDFQTIDLHDQINDPLADYFAWMTVQHAPFRILPREFGKTALESNPGAVQVLDSVSVNNSGPPQHELTAQASRDLNRLVSTLATDAAAPRDVRSAAQIALSEQFSPTALLTLLSTFDKLPDEPGVPLQWSTYASIVRDCQFVNCVRQLEHLYGDGEDVSNMRDQWLTLLRNHRYAAFIASYGKPKVMPPANIVEAVRRIDFKDDALSATLLTPHLEVLKIDKDPRRDVFWFIRQRQQSGNTSVDLAFNLWLYQSTDVNSDAEIDKRRTEDWRSEAEVLASVCPNHPLAIAVQLITNPQETLGRAEQIEHDFAGNPIVTYGLGRAYLQAGRIDEAIRLLEYTVQLAPDYPAYYYLANAHLAKDDVQGWLDALETYMKTPKDIPVANTSVCRMMALRLLEMGDLGRAVEYADRAVKSGSEPDVECKVLVLLALGEYDQADELMHRFATNYNYVLDYYRFVRSTGHGDLETALRLVTPVIRRFETSQNPNDLRWAAQFYAFESQPDKAELLWQRLLRMDHNYINLMFLSIHALEKNDRDQAISFLTEANKLNPSFSGDSAYASGVAEMLRCIKDHAIPDQTGHITYFVKKHTNAAQCGNVCYCLGRICELNHHDEEAKWWYRAAMKTPDMGFMGRPLAFNALKRLGEDYYK